MMVKSCRMAAVMLTALALSLCLSSLAQADIPGDYAAWWRFDGDASEQSGNYNGTPSGNAEFSAGVRGGAYTMDGTGDSISVPLGLRDKINPTVNSVTLSCWWQPSETTESDTRDEVLFGGFMYHWFIGVPGNVPTAYIYNSSAQMTTVSSNVQAVAGEWVHVAAVYGNDHSIAIYVNGELQNTGTWEGAFQSATDYLKIASRGTTFAGGKIDEMLVYDRALSAAEIAGICELQQAPNTAPTLAPLADVATDENTSISFTLSGNDPDGDKIVYKAEGLPEGAVLDSETGEFTWSPTYTQAGLYEITFAAGDFIDEAAQTVKIRVHNIPPGDANDDQKVDVLDLLAIRNAMAESYRAAADVNEDGVINVLDLIATRNNMGLIVDAKPPAKVTNLTAGYDPDQKTVRLAWTAPGDDGAEGTAGFYDIRYSTSQIASESDWAAATELDGEPLPAEAGTAQQMVVNAAGLPETLVFFALRTFDLAGNQSAISNSPSDYIGAAPVSEGWTNLTPSADSRMIYVSSSTGNDGWDGYAPEWDGASGPKRTINAGKNLLRNGFPDWLLLKRGDVWYEGLGTWRLFGRSSAERMVVTAYGTGARPLLKTGAGTAINAFGGGVSNLAFTSLYFLAHTRDPKSPEFTGPDGSNGVHWYASGQNLLWEDCVFQFYVSAMVFDPYESPNYTNARIRRCILIDSYATNQHSQGLVLRWMRSSLAEENLLDHNGWNENVAGAQPTIFNHNSYTTFSRDMVVRNNISARASSFGLTMTGRAGNQYINPVVENNLFVENGNTFTHGGDDIYSIVNTTIRNNVILNTGRTIGGSPQSLGMHIGCTDGAMVEGNIFAHKGGGGSSYSIDMSRPARNVTIRNNTVYNWRSGYINIPSTNYNNVTVDGNILQDHLYGSVLHRHGGQLGSITYRNGRYFTTGSSWFYAGGSNRDFNGWLGFSHETGARAENVQFVDPNRDVATYQASLGKQASLEAFIAEARKQSKTNWRPEYTAAAVNNYIRQGFTVK